MSTRDIAAHRHKLATSILLAIALASAGLVFISFGLLGADYWYVFRPTAQAFVQGKTLLFDIGAPGWYMAPWALVFILPTLLFPPVIGQAILICLSLAGMLFAIRQIAGNSNIWIVLLSVANLFSVGLLSVGNMDGILLAAIGIGWYATKNHKPWILGASLTILAMKPINIILPALVLLSQALTWNKKDLLRTLTIPAVVMIASLCIFGDWPLRYINSYKDFPPLIHPQTSLWKCLAWWGLPRWPADILTATILIIAVTRIRKLSISQAITLNLAFSPYVLGAHYVLAAPAFVTASRSKLCIAIILWILTLTPLLRLQLNWDTAWIDALYPLVLSALFLHTMKQEEDTS